MIYTALETCATIYQKARIIKCHNKLFSLYHFIYVEDTFSIFKLTSILERLTSFYVSNLLRKKNSTDFILKCWRRNVKQMVTNTLRPFMEMFLEVQRCTKLGRS